LKSRKYFGENKKNKMKVFDEKKAKNIKIKTAENAI
jgi:hypothetical protein